ncbi:MAG: hypothetical protein ACREJA_00760 [Candidatus Methylomirabilales bacterium]
MKYEGMVHALEEIRRLLSPAGSLIDIHPALEAPLIKVCQDGRALFAEPSPAYDYEEDLRQAEHALAQVVQRRLFVIERSGVFDFLTYGSSVAELRDFWENAGAYDDRPKGEAVAAREAELYARVDKIMQAAGQGAEVVGHERGRIARLRPVR